MGRACGRAGFRGGRFSRPSPPRSYDPAEPWIGALIRGWSDLLPAVEPILEAQLQPAGPDHDNPPAPGIRGPAATLFRVPPVQATESLEPTLPKTTLVLDRDEHGAQLSLSGAAARGHHLFVAPDEGASIVRMHRRSNGTYHATETYRLADLVPVPGAAGDEVDLEGMDITDEFLWVVGSHSAVRKRIPGTTPTEEISERLASVEHPPARRLLARIPLATSGGSGPQPVPRAGSAGRAAVWAASLPAHGRGHPSGPLLGTLRRDDHLAPFVGLPGKDNGLDVEGIAVVGRRVLLGLRGPVLRGWAVILEIEPQPCAGDPRSLELAPLTSSGRSGTVIKHFLDLGGLGVRDLARHGDDLLILAGPTMVLDGPSRVLRLGGAGSGPMPPAVRAGDLHQVGKDLHVGVGEDHPEAITVVLDGADERLLVLDDSPSSEHVDGRKLRAELIPLR